MLTAERLLLERSDKIRSREPDHAASGWHQEQKDLEKRDDSLAVWSELLIV